jgi:predicted membrane-bound spermidine synthase
MSRIQAILTNPRALLTIDLFGALLTGLVTLLVLAPERIPTGLPSRTLYLFGTIACCFALFDALALTNQRFAINALRIISLLNLTYCIGTLIICILHFQQVTVFGLVYFALEIPVVLTIAWWEWTVAKKSIGRRERSDAR